jgi:GNAT superfamily N-acetyltransferase
MRMIVTQGMTYLEMTSPAQLRPGRPAPEPVRMEAHDGGSQRMRSTHDRVAAPHHWSSRTWSDAQWAEYVSRAGLHRWLAWVGDEVAGLLAVQADPGGDAEIDMFGLVPEYVGRGFGAHVLTVSTELAWGVGGSGGGGSGRAERVWLHTSSLDHPHALRNYERRGFRRFRTESVQRQLPE